MWVFCSLKKCEEYLECILFGMQIVLFNFIIFLFCPLFAEEFFPRLVLFDTEIKLFNSLNENNGILINKI